MYLFTKSKASVFLINMEHVVFLKKLIMYNLNKLLNECRKMAYL